MGREVKRVPLDFDWPLRQVWKGYLNPYYKHFRKCPFCDGSGYNPETKQLSDDWYAFGSYYARWCDKITQDEVDALVEKGRLYDFTHEIVRGHGWVKKDPPYHPTAREVNTWARNGRGHDAINQWICVSGSPAAGMAVCIRAVIRCNTRTKMNIHQ